MRFAAKILAVHLILFALAFAQSAPPAPTGLQSYTWSTGALLWWHNDNDVDSYQIQVSTNSLSFIPLVGPSTSNSAFAFANGLTSGTKYYWRVRGVHNNTSGAWSAISSFTTSGSAPGLPSPPTLVSPTSGATGVSTSPTLTWNASTGANIYALQVSTSSSFSSNVENQSSISGTSYSLSGLANNTQYYWHVNATNAGGTSQYSTTWNFTTIVVAPAAPILSSPADTSSGISTAPTLSWIQVSGATSYTLQVSTSSGFTTMVVNQS
ncbi:fibronectin type III domain-containing protein, partial [bacterium]